MLNKCYICNFERLIFDKNAEGGFVRHIEHDHNLWEYIYYIVHLDAKDTSDHNGIESYVVAKLSEDDISWVPRQKALCLENIQDDEEEDQAVDEVNKIMQGWLQRIRVCLLQCSQGYPQQDPKEREIGYLADRLRMKRRKRNNILRKSLHLKESKTS